ncbi:hypothetical protein GTP44_23530 [Duganella sp. FT50W]|uniref:Glutathionylspermidine synthase pre-ATP-grasp-like domain-containing protein n=1 Tax=Duganella lactea TaxID=2692173 RepID=A0A6L8MSB3_9BURK|nr:hypothetical protein [Duganella lactea]MYM84906.1 hypothetical protein [Duganella lactea]
MNQIDKFKNNRFYSAQFAQLMQQLEERPATFGNAGSNGYEDLYQVASWPFIISRERVAHFDRFIGRLHDIYWKAIQIFFAGDAEKFSQYLNVPALAYTILQEYGCDRSQILGRHDILFCNGQLKLIEVNSGSSIGGWQTGVFEAELRSLLASVDLAATGEIRHRNAMESMFSSLLDAISQQQAAQAEANILLFGIEDDVWQAEISSRFALVAQDRSRRGVRPGKLLFASDWSQIRFSHSGKVCVGSEAVDAILLVHAENNVIPPVIQMKLTSAHLANKLVMPDSGRSTLWGNKLLMALVHEPEVLSQLDAEERAWVREYIPFTVPLCERALAWRGTWWELSEMLKRRKDDFVIKKAHSLQGRDVFIGKFLDSETWTAIIDDHLGVSDWLAQEYCVPDMVWGPGTAGNLIEYSLIWGVFDTGGRYGGSYVRGVPAGHGNGVINAATGAARFTVFEDAVRKSRISL